MAERNTKPTVQRIPPQNIDAEEALLGAMLLSQDALADTVGIVRPEHFYRPVHATIHEAITALYASGDPVDPVTVAAELERLGATEAVGGLEGLHHLQMTTPASSNAAKYARLVQGQYRLRELIRVAGEISELGYGQPADVDAAVDQAENLVLQAADREGEDTLKAHPQLTKEAVDLIWQRQQSRTFLGTPTGFIDLDKTLSGLKPGALIVVGARPAMGKTSFILNVASHVAFREQQPALLFSLEMSSLEIEQRVFAAENRVDSKSMTDGRVRDDDMRKIASFVETYEHAPFFVDDNPNPNIMEIRAKARRVKHKQGALGLVIVDYLQLMSGRGRAENRQVEVAEISRGLKILARELKCPVIGVSQLSRNLESRSDKRPILSDLRESGSIEQDADVVLFLYRDEVYHPQPEPDGLTEVNVSKNRNGPGGTIMLNFQPRFTRFSSHTAQSL